MPFRIETDSGPAIVYVDFYNNQVFQTDGEESPYAKQVLSVLHKRNTATLSPLPHLNEELSKLADQAVSQQDTLLKRGRNTTEKVMENGSSKTES